MFHAQKPHPPAPQQDDPQSAQVSRKKAYKIKEDDLWVKLFHQV